MGVLERLSAFALRLELCADADVRSAYEKLARAMTELDDEALCLISLCLDEAKRRSLDMSNWPGVIVSVPIGAGAAEHPPVDDDPA